MYIKNRTVSALFKLLTAALGFLGLGLSLFHGGQPRPDMLLYFTNLSNLFAAVVFLCAGLRLLRRRTPRTPCPVLKSTAMMSLTVTMLVAHFLLGGFTMGGTMSLSLLLLHYVVPLMALLDWLLFDEKGLMTPAAPVLWVIAPLVYFGCAMLGPAIGLTADFGGSRYPYPFIDLDLLGSVRVALTALVLLAFFLALGYIFVLIDRLLKRAGRPQ